MATVQEILAARAERTAKIEAIARERCIVLYERAMAFVDRGDAYADENQAEMNRLCGMLHEALPGRRRRVAAEIVVNSGFPTLLSLPGVYKEMLDETDDTGVRS